MLQVCKEWFKFSQPFVGIGASIMDDEEDLVALVASSDSDFLSRSLQDLVGRLLPVSTYFVIGSTTILSLTDLA